MSDSIKCTPEVKEAIDELKQEEAFRYIIFGLVNDDKKIGVIEKSLRDAIFEDLKEDLKEAAASGVGRYILYDYESDSGKRILVLITWIPSYLPAQQRMLVSSSKDALKRVLIGVHPELVINDEDDFTYDNLTEKALSGQSPTSDL